MRGGVRGLLALVATVGGLVVATRALEPVPFSRWIQVEMVSDSIWENCRLKISVDEAGKGSTELDCKAEGVVTNQSRGKLSSQEVEELRRLLREADLFQGQFWGEDARGLDLPLITLVVNDGFKVVAMVCFKNKSFETGGRERLLASLTNRLRSGRQKAK